MKELRKGNKALLYNNVILVLDIWPNGNPFETIQISTKVLNETRIEIVYARIIVNRFETYGQVLVLRIYLLLQDDKRYDRLVRCCQYLSKAIYIRKLSFVYGSVYEFTMSFMNINTKTCSSLVTVFIGFDNYPSLS